MPRFRNNRTFELLHVKPSQKLEKPVLRAFKALEKSVTNHMVNSHRSLSVPSSLHAVMAESEEAYLAKNKKSTRSDIADIWLKFEQLYTRK
ncbi:hypothetical protein KIN20_025708 [Parelaphostrongylus tenuis]|uniref:Uncharacterized protein n=1 Tax=Parelaphostrongylus tenuis TaxID=148309 RepID=A0AAD5MVN8_PARTN|nr:hypothetical protein KIN20_025708 [Parelaphostrongylus tenuis]